MADVANAVYDGADCVMLSGESAKGKYFQESIAAMKACILEADHWPQHNRGVPAEHIEAVDTGMFNEMAAVRTESCLVTGWRGQVQRLPEVVFCPPAGNNQPVVWYFRKSIA